MALRIFAFCCLAISLIGIVPVLLNPSIHDHVALILFAIVMIFMGLGFMSVSRALSKMAGVSNTNI